MNEISARDFGKLEAEVEALGRKVDEMAGDLKAVRSAMDAAGDGWRVLVAVGGLSGAMTGFAVKFLPFFR